MADRLSDLVERGKTHSQRGRALLAETPDEPVDPAVEATWRVEIRKRAAAYERGEATLFDAEEVIAEATRLTQ